MNNFELENYILYHYILIYFCVKFYMFEDSKKYLINLLKLYLLFGLKLTLKGTQALRDNNYDIYKVFCFALFFLLVE